MWELRCNKRKTPGPLKGHTYLAKVRRSGSSPSRDPVTVPAICLTDDGGRPPPLQGREGTAFLKGRGPQFAQTPFFISQTTMVYWFFKNLLNTISFSLSSQAELLILWNSAFLIGWSVSVYTSTSPVWLCRWWLCRINLCILRTWYPVNTGWIKGQLYLARLWS